MSDSNIIVGAKIQIDTGTSDQAVQQVNKSVTDLKGNLKDAGATITSTNKTVDESGTSFKNLHEQISKMPGGLGDASEGVGKLSTAFKSLLANPVVLVITALVGALALLYKAFTNSFEGGEKMEQVFAGIKAAGTEVLTIILDMGKAIYKFFTGDWKGAAEDAKAAVQGIVHGVSNAYNAMSNLTKQAQQLARDQADNDLDQAKRQARLAELRAQAYDDTIPIAKRKAALLELRKDSEQNAADDMALAKKVADNKIAMLTVEKDGAKKNYVEIQQIRADQIKGETENANELRNIGRQISSANKQEIAERKADAAKAAEEAKKRREEYQAYISQLTKLQQENTLAQIKDGYAKEQQALEFKISNEADTLKKEFENKKITRDQYDHLVAAQQIAADSARVALTEKHDADVAKKEQAFQDELNKIRMNTTLNGVEDVRKSEMAKLQIGYEEKLQQAIKAYKDNAVQFQAIKNALDAQLKSEQDKLQAKFKLEDDKKEFKTKADAAKLIAADKSKEYKDRLAAVDQEQKLTKAAFDNKLLTEQEYNDKVAGFANARDAIRKQELDNAFAAGDALANLFNGISELMGKQTAAGKAFAIASATIATIESAVKSFNALADIPIVGPALGAVAAAAAIVSGINNVKKIVAVQVPGQGAGGAGAPSVTAPKITAPLAPTQRSTSINQDSVNNIGNAAAGGVNAVRAYVVESDSKDARERDARLSRAARLGG